MMRIPMKMWRAALLAAAALTLADAAVAGATLHDVETAVKVNHDFRQAENLMREVVANDPDNARDHYVYSQILRHNGEHEEAVREMAQARRLDPALSFDKDPQRVAAYEASLQAEGGVMSAPTSTPMSAPEHRSGVSLIWVALLLAAVGVAAVVFFRRMQERDRVEDVERMNVLRQQQMRQANALLESLKALKLDIRIASPANPPLLAQADAAETELVGLLERLATLPVAPAEIERHAEALAHLQRAFEGQPDPLPAQPAMHEVAQYGDAGPGGFAPVAVPVYQPVMPQTVYMQDSGMSGVGGLLTGMALGSMMSGGREREVIREVREVPYRESGDDSRPSDIDFGNDGSSDNSGDSDSGSVDFGASDDN